MQRLRVRLLSWELSAYHRAIVAEAESANAGQARKALLDGGAWLLASSWHVIGRPQYHRVPVCVVLVMCELRR